jgi:uncharacterized membrane protein
MTPLLLVPVGITILLSPVLWWVAKRAKPPVRRATQLGLWIIIFAGLAAVIVLQAQHH